MSNSDVSQNELIELLSCLVNDPKFTQHDDLNQACNAYPQLKPLVETILEIRSSSLDLSRGKLDEEVEGRGFILSCIKALQSNLHHLVWQLNQVAKGDFSQRIDFLGEFSESFNAMCEKLEGQNQILNELARQDSLTKLANRQYLEEYLTSLFDSNGPFDVDFCLIIFDLDFFKRVNDTYGHDAGDIVLEGVASYLRNVFRTSDFLARFGGEEFIAVLPNVSIEQAKVAAQRALDYLEEHPIRISKDEEVLITASAGISERASHDTGPEKVFKRSDMALYKAKQAGRNRIEWILADDTSVNEEDHKITTTPIDSDEPL